VSVSTLCVDLRAKLKNEQAVA